MSQDKLQWEFFLKRRWIDVICANCYQIFDIANLWSIEYKSIVFFLDEKPVDLIKHSRVKINDFEIIKVIGRGAFGEVQLVSLCTSKLFRVIYDSNIHIKYCISMCSSHLHLCASFYAFVAMHTWNAAEMSNEHSAILINNITQFFIQCRTFKERTSLEDKYHVEIVLYDI